MRVVVIGAGPVGLEAAARATADGHEVTVYEAGRIGAGVRTWSALRAWDPWSAWVGPAGVALLGAPPAPDAHPTGREIVGGWLEPLAARLDVRALERVVGIARGGRGVAERPARFRIVVENVGGERTFDEADRVLDAGGAGTWGSAGPDGLPLPSENRAASAGRLRYGPVDPDDLPPGPILVIGDDPAVGPQIAALLAAGREVHHAPHHGPPADHPGCVVHPPVERFGRSVEGITVHTAAGRFHAAQVVALAGRRPDRSWVRELPLAWTPDEAPDPAREPAWIPLGHRRYGRIAVPVARALAESASALGSQEAPVLPSL